MHRHGYQGKKFGREADQRSALIAGLADSLVLSESIETTLPKAKETARYTEKLITKAKAGGLANRRLLIKRLSTVEAAHKLMDNLAPKLSARNSGYLRIERTSVRRGDGAQLARISFVDDLSVKPVPKPKPKPVAKATAKPVAKKAATPKKTPRKAPAKKAVKK